MASSFKQSGMSFIGVVIVAGGLAAGGVVLAQSVPIIMEYQAVLKAVDKAKGGNSAAEARMIFNKAASIDNISSITAQELDIKKVNDKWEISFAYKREIHLAGPVFLTYKYEGKSL